MEGRIQENPEWDHTGSKVMAPISYANKHIKFKTYIIDGIGHFLDRLYLLSNLS